MKQSFLALILMFNLSNALAQNVIEVTAATTLSPIVTALKLVEGSALTLASPLLSTLATTQSRGVAGREQIKDELVAFNSDVMNGGVRSIKDVRQPALRELFEEILADEAQMDEINLVVTEGPDLHKVATAVAVVMLLE
jgi:hypothetical protein